MDILGILTIWTPFALVEDESETVFPPGRVEVIQSFAPSVRFQALTNRVEAAQKLSPPQRSQNLRGRT